MMKLLIMTAVKSYERQAIELFKHAKIVAFSNTDINGFKAIDQEDLLDNWFSNSSENVKSVLFFAFCEEKNIDDLLGEMDEVNRQLKSNNPLKAIVLNIEKYK